MSKIKLLEWDGVYVNEVSQRDRMVWSTGKVLVLYSGRARVESRPEHGLSWMRLFVGCLISPRQMLG
jgi:hypothetical protein